MQGPRELTQRELEIMILMAEARSHPRETILERIEAIISDEEIGVEWVDEKFFSLIMGSSRLLPENKKVFAELVEEGLIEVRQSVGKRGKPYNEYRLKREKAE